MAFETIELSELTSGKPITRGFALKVKNSLDDLNLRAGQSVTNLGNQYTELNNKIEALKAVPPVVALAGADIDWSLGQVFSKTITANTDFNFQNSSNGKTIVVHLKNTTSSALTLSWPISVRGGRTSIPANKVLVLTFIAIDNFVFSTGVEF